MINPHAILVLDVTDASGKNVRWQAEMGGAQGLIRGGWTTDVKPGTKVTLTGRRLKSGAPYMNLTERARVVLTDTGKEVLRNANFGQPAPTGGGGTSDVGGPRPPATREAAHSAPVPRRPRAQRFSLGLGDSLAFFSYPSPVILHLHIPSVWRPQ